MKQTLIVFIIATCDFPEKNMLQINTTNGIYYLTEDRYKDETYFSFIQECKTQKKHIAFRIYTEALFIDLIYPVSFDTVLDIIDDPQNNDRKEITLEKRPSRVRVLKAHPQYKYFMDALEKSKREHSSLGMAIHPSSREIEAIVVTGD